MQTFTGFEYILIDIANQFGHDKWTFEQRIEWVKDNLPALESLTPLADCKPLYIKGVMALRKAQAGQPTGHIIGFDACCSGIQMMSALTGCIAGATATGMVDPAVRADAYSKATEIMCTILGNSHVAVSRDDAKTALMTAFYGSRAEPKAIFGEDTPEISAFYEAANTLAPGAWELLQDLLGSWQPFALSHQWQLPDGFEARVKVMERVESRIEVDELDHATFTYEYYINQGSKNGLSNAANVTHSVDAYVLRCIHRRCNYNPEVVAYADQCIQAELLGRSLYGQMTAEDSKYYLDTKLSYYIELYNRTGMADAVILPYLTQENVTCLSQKHLEALAAIVKGMLAYRPFEVITVHDEFKCGPNHMNHLRQQYINVLAELAESNLLDAILSQLHGVQGHFTKLSSNLGSLIRGSNYALS